MQKHDQPSLGYLTFPDVKFGARETPWDLSILLYKGGAKVLSRQVAQLIATGALGEPQFERLELISKLHEEINAALASGRSRETGTAQILNLRYFFGFADRTGRPLTLERVVETYCAWTDWLFQRTRVSKRTAASKRDADSRPIGMHSAYAYASTVGALLDKILDRHTPAVELTRLERRTKRKSAVGVQAEKQNLESTFAFGHLLQDLCDGLTIQAVREAPFPVQILLRSGETLTRSGDRACHPHAENQNLGRRYPLANLRLEAELMMFIGQTGMNRAQAVRLELSRFFYMSHLDGYHVKEHKDRRGGSVLFEIFKEYKPHFERYLEWRRTLLPNSKLLFPFIGVGGSRPEVRFDGYRVRAVCKELNFPFVPPRLLRNTRVNWLLRKSADPDLSAEMSQHAKETLLKVYHQPSLQRAMVESTHFWSKFDPLSTRTQSVAPGDCNGKPKEVVKAPKQAVTPNCDSASGCLWCESHRDIDSLDYVWALTTFGHLKAIELSRARLPQSDKDVPPAKHAIDRIQEKLRWFEQSSAMRREWVEEAQTRIAEGYFHSSFGEEIEELEGTP
jgi:hypothetical protein